jgi:hypothetical protein
MPCYGKPLPLLYRNICANPAHVWKHLGVPVGNGTVATGLICRGIIEFCTTAQRIFIIALYISVHLIYRSEICDVCASLAAPPHPHPPASIRKYLGVIILLMCWRTGMSSNSWKTRVITWLTWKPRVIQETRVFGQKLLVPNRGKRGGGGSRGTTKWTDFHLNTSFISANNLMTAMTWVGVNVTDGKSCFYTHIQVSCHEGPQFSSYEIHPVISFNSFYGVPLSVTCNISSFFALFCTFVKFFLLYVRLSVRPYLCNSSTPARRIWLKSDNGKFYYRLIIYSILITIRLLLRIFYMFLHSFLSNYWIIIGIISKEILDKSAVWPKHFFHNP